MKGSMKIAALALCVTGAMATTVNASTPPNQKCQLGISAATKAHYANAYAAYDTCLVSSLKGKPCSAVKVITGIGAAGDKLRKGINKACGGEALATAGLTAIGAIPANSPCRDSTENPGSFSSRELAQCIARDNLNSVGTALLDAYACKATNITLGGASGSTIQAGGSIIPVTLSGTSQVCYHVLSSDTDASGATGKHAAYYKNTSLAPVVIAANLTVCVNNAFGPGQINCSADTTNLNAPTYFTLSDHVINLDGAGVRTANNVWDDKTTVCSSNGGAGAPFDFITTKTICAGLTPAGKLVSPKYGAPSTKDCILKATKSKEGALSCLEGDSDGTVGASAGDGSTKDYVKSGCATGSGPGQPAAGHSDGNTGIACNSGTSVLESGLTCVGANVGAPCTKDSDCWVLDNDAFVGKCKTKTGVAAGDLIVLNTIAFDSKDPTAGDCGTDGTCCTADDAALGSGGAPVIVPSTTGTTSSAVIDAGPSAGGNKIADGESCGGPACIAKLTGATTSCANLLAGTATGLSTVGSFSTLDGATYGDAVITFRFEQ